MVASRDDFDVANIGVANNIEFSTYDASGTFCDLKNLDVAKIC